MTEITVECDLVHLFGEARDQGGRPTCLAFAASDAHAALRPGWQPLSCEYAFYCAQRRGHRSANVGARLPDMLDALREDGQPQEEGWPYLDVSSASGQVWQPPADVGDIYRRRSTTHSATFDEILRSLNGGTPILVLIYLSPSFYHPGPGGVIAPSADEQLDYAQRHAVIGVGYGVSDSERAVLIRNSWGKDWGRDGYAWITESYLSSRLMHLAVLTEKIDGPDAQQATRLRNRMA